MQWRLEPYSTGTTKRKLVCTIYLMTNHGIMEIFAKRPYNHMDVVLITQKKVYIFKVAGGKTAY